MDGDPKTENEGHSGGKDPEFPGGLVGEGSTVVTAVAPVRSLTQDLTYAMGTAKKKKKTQNICGLGTSMFAEERGLLWLDPWKQGAEQ